MTFANASSTAIEVFKLLSWNRCVFLSANIFVSLPTEFYRYEKGREFYRYEKGREFSRFIFLTVNCSQHVRELYHHVAFQFGDGDDFVQVIKELFRGLFLVAN